MRRALTLALAVLVVAAGATWLAFSRDMRAAHDRVTEGTAVVETRHGPVTYRAGGAGPPEFAIHGAALPVLAIHGAGGGHDQGQLLAEAFVPAGYRWIAPSRFGYPGSPMPPDPSTAAQADAFAQLLDELGVERVTVLGMSGGVPPALQFALRHPERTNSLVLLSLAPYAPLTAEEQELPIPIWLYDALFATDLPLWALHRIAPRSLEPMFDAPPELAARMTPAEAGFLGAMIRAFFPVTLRREGLQNEGAAIDPRAAIDPTRITVPALVVHARDDQITPFSTATFTAERIPGAELLALDRGGHLLLGHHEEVRHRIASFLDALPTTRTPD